MDGNESWTIRAYQEDDEDQVIDLWRVSFPDDGVIHEPKAAISRKLTVQRDLFLVGELDGKVVATALAGFDGYRGWVYRVAVAGQAQNRGFGRAIMLETERRLRAMGCAKLNLQVRANNSDVLKFYERLGYTVNENISMGKIL
jgi:ribosomal protein S18 acetylase RimI-like enzyme